MALTATFAADFSSFYDAVQKAEVGLRGFEASAEKVGLTLDRMVDKFSGRKLIEDATLMATAVEKIGGVSKLTEAELKRLATTTGEAIEKMQAMGIDVPKGLENINTQASRLTTSMGATDKAVGALQSTFTQLFAGFTLANIVDKAVSSLGAFTLQALESASAIVDMSEKTGASIEAVQRWGYVAQTAGGDVEGMANAAFKLGVTLAGGDNSVKAAVDALGLSWEALRRMKPEDQFDAVVGALSTVEDAQTRNQLAVELFGKSIDAILPAIGSDYRNLADDARVASDAQVRAVDDALKAWNSLKANLETGILQTFGKVAVAADLMHKASAGDKAAMTALAGFYGPQGALVTGLSVLGGAMGLFKDNTEAATTAQQGNVGITRDQVEAALRAREEAEKLAIAQKNVQEALAGAAGVTPAVQEEIRYLLEMGAAQSDVALVTGTTGAAVRAIAEDMRAEAEASKEAARQAEEHAKKLQEQQAALEAVTDVYRGPEGINPAVHDLAIELLQLGAAQGDVAKAFDLSKTAIKGLVQEVKDINEQTKNLTDSIAQLMLQAAQARKANLAAQGFDLAGNRLPGTPAEQAQADYERKMAELQGRIAAAGPGGAAVDVSAIQEQYWRELQEALGNTAEAADNLTRAQQEQEPAVRDTTDANKQNAPKAREAADAHDRVAKAGSGAAAVLVQAATGIQQSFFKAFQQSERYQRELEKAAAMGAAGVGTGHAAVGGIIRDAFGRPVAGIPGMPVVNVPGFQHGGATTAGLAMLHDNEYVVPQGGALVKGGSVPTVGTVVVNYPIMNDDRALSELARLVSSALLREFGQSGGRLPM